MGGGGVHLLRSDPDQNMTVAENLYLDLYNGSDFNAAGGAEGYTDDGNDKFGDSMITNNTEVASRSYEQNAGSYFAIKKPCLRSRKIQQT